MEVVTSAPGKLFLMGEYAALAGGSAVVAAVSRRLRCRARRTPGTGRVRLRRGTLTFEIGLEANTLEGVPQELRFVAAAALLAVRAVGVRGADLSLEALGDIEVGGRKLGLGSSAAISAAGVAAIFALGGLPLDERTLLRRVRIGVLSHRLAQVGGSGADVVAATVGGIVAVGGLDGSDCPRSLDDGLGRLNAGGPSLGFRSVLLPDPLRLVVGWTGRPARTGPRAARFSSLLGRSPADATLLQWVEGMEAASASFVAGCESSDARSVVRSVGAASDLLERLAPALSVPIFTRELRQACRVAHRLGIAAKPSGAGGGDCVVGLCEPEQRATLERAWAESGVTPVDLDVEPTGALEEVQTEKEAHG